MLLVPPAQKTMSVAALVFGVAIPAVYVALVAVICAVSESRVSVPLLEVLLIEAGITFHPPIFAEFVVNKPVAPAIVVCLKAFPDRPLENVIPEELSMYPALVRDPPVSPVEVTVFPPIVPLYTDAPLAIFMFPLNEPFLALRSPSIINEAPSH